MILCFDPKDQVEILFPMVYYVDVHIKINFQGPIFCKISWFEHFEIEGQDHVCSA